MMPRERVGIPLAHAKPLFPRIGIIRKVDEPICEKNDVAYRRQRKWLARISHTHLLRDDQVLAWQRQPAQFVLVRIDNTPPVKLLVFLARQALTITRHDACEKCGLGSSGSWSQFGAVDRPAAHSPCPRTRPTGTPFLWTASTPPRPAASAPCRC